MVLILFFKWINVFEMSIFNIFSTLWWCCAFYLSRCSVRVALLSNIGNIGEIIVHSILCTHYVGWNYGFAFHLYSLPLVIFLLPKRDCTLKAILAIATLAGFIVCMGICREKPPVYQVQVLQNTLFLINISVPLLFISLITIHYARFAEIYEHRIEKEKERSDYLLKNILPVPIIERLHIGHGEIADEYRNVSVLFADVVGFTPATSRRSPKKVVSFLNTLFLRFDEIAEKYALEKIKTIGDAYMVTAGVPEPVDNHAERIATGALEMMRVAETVAFFGESLQLRIGINSGPVVAGIIGKKKFSYDLWGDTVNTAARMESHGIAGRIHTTGGFRTCAGKRFLFEKRGVIRIRGKGDMETWFLTGMKQEDG